MAKRSDDDHANFVDAGILEVIAVGECCCEGSRHGCLQSIASLPHDVSTQVVLLQKYVANIAA